MGRKNGGWLSRVKKALTHGSKDKNKAEKSNKSKKKSSGNENLSVNETPDPVPEQRNPPMEEVKLMEVDIEQMNHGYGYSVTGAAPSASQTASTTSRFATKVTRVSRKSKPEVAAIRIQTAFRGYLARRAFRGLRGLVRLKSFVDGPIVKRQTSSTLKCMQALSHVQSQIQSRRARMLEENRVLQRQLLQKQAKEMESFRIGEEWDDSLRSKEKIEENLLHKYEATMRRERALAYSYTHQQTLKRSSKQTNLLFMDPTNPQWGWSWLERWMASQPKDIIDQPPSSRTTSAGEIVKSFARHQLNSEANHRPPSPATPTSKMASFSGGSRKTRSGGSSSKKHRSLLNQVADADDDSRSMFSVQSNRNRRHSIAGSSIRDDESLASSSPSIPSYMAPTHSAKAKISLPSPLVTENGRVPASAASAKKRLSFPPSPGRRLSTPRKVEAAS